MLSPDRGVSADLCRFIDASPSPFHAVEEAAARLRAAGFRERAEGEAWEAGRGSWYVRRSGSLVAWRVGERHDPTAGFRLIGAHTDSPNLRVKPKPDMGRAGFRQIGVEVYGGVLHNSWLDRDLGLSGRVAVDGGTRLLRIDEPLFRIPQLAIHLDRQVNDNGLVLNAQSHMVPVWGQGQVEQGAFAELVAHTLGVQPADVLAWDLMLHDVTPARAVGRGGDLIAAPRIDNLASCHSALTALVRVGAEAGPHVPVVCLFDHEEVGSVSSTGAGSSILPVLLQRVVSGLGGGTDEFAVACARSICLSADGAHATHPNYVDRHEPEHQLRLNGGPAIKRNSNQRYATDAVGQAAFAAACRAADVPHQVFVNKTDLACGSTIGPITSSRLGMTTVDAGIPQLAMHSARETCGADDPSWFAAAMEAFLVG